MSGQIKICQVFNIPANQELWAPNLDPRANSKIDHWDIFQRNWISTLGLGADQSLIIKLFEEHVNCKRLRGKLIEAGKRRENETCYRPTWPLPKVTRKRQVRSELVTHVWDTLTLTRTQKWGLLNKTQRNRFPSKTTWKYTKSIAKIYVCIFYQKVAFHSRTERRHFWHFIL